MMNKILLVVGFLLPATLLAQPSTRVAWTPETLNFVKAGQPEKGEQLAAACTGCHGGKGNSNIPHVPSLAGQLSTYLYKQLQDYADGSRDQFVMTPIAKGLSEQDKADLAAWFSRQAAVNSKLPKKDLKRAAVLVKDGDTKRTIPPCEVCHGSDGQGGKQSVPVLAGQQAGYIKMTLNAYKKGKRHNDIYSRMRSIAQLLEDKEIDELGRYYQQMD